MNIEKFNEIVKTIDDNIDMFNYIVTPDGKLLLICEFYEDGKHYVKPWNSIKSHDEVINERLKANMMKESNK